LRGFAKAALPEARLLLLGDGPCRAGLEGLAGELGIAGKVVFAGHVEDTSRLYAALDVFVMSSDTEQMPLALLEAMACGLPAVCTDAGDTAAMLDETPVPIGNVDAYAEALRRLAADAGLRASLGAKNRQRAASMYSLDHMVNEYDALYTAALRR
jgi:L-malate glycosyltransferase